MTHGLKSLKYPALTCLFSVLAATLACSSAPAASTDNYGASSSNSISVPAEDVQTSRASWQVTAGEDSSVQPLLDTLPSKEPSQPPAAEIDADEIVAAYERVIGDVHDNVLPSVVSVFVLNRVEILQFNSRIHFSFSIWTKASSRWRLAARIFFQKRAGLRIRMG